MAQGKRVTASQVENLKQIWISSESKKPVDIHSKFVHQYGKGVIGIRKCEQLIPTFTLSASGGRIPLFDYKKWSPWTKKGNSLSKPFLLTMDAVSQVLQNRHIYAHEAEWGERLRIALDGLKPYDQFCFVILYALREVMAHYREEEEVVTTDLDLILTYKPWPWLPKNIHAFNMVAFARPASLGNWVLEGRLTKGMFPSFDWHRIAGDHFLPWHIERPRREPGTSQEVKECQAADAALRFWMGPEPLFGPPLYHEELGLPDLSQPRITSVTITGPDGVLASKEVPPRFKPDEETEV